MGTGLAQDWGFDEEAGGHTPERALEFACSIVLFAERR